MTSLVTDYLLIDRVHRGLGGGGGYLVWVPCILSESQTYAFFWAYRLNHVALKWVIFFLWFPMKLCARPYGWEREFAHRLVFRFFDLLTCYTYQLLVISKYEEGFNFEQQIQAGIRNIRKCFYLQRILFSRVLLNDLKAMYNKKAPSQVMSELQPSLLEAVHALCLFTLSSNMNCIIKL